MSKYVQIIDSGVVISRPDNVFGYSAWPSVARDANGDLLVAFSGNRIMHVCPFGKVLIVKSKDEGKTWSAPMIAVDTPLDDRDAGILNVGDGRLVVTTFNNTRENQRKWAEGGKYGTEVLRNLALAYLPTLCDAQEEKYYGSLMSISEDNGFSWGEPFKVPVSAPHGPNLLKNGSLIYAGIPFPGKPAGSSYPIAVYRSDNYRDFYKLADIPVCPEAPDVLYVEPHIIELPNGRLVLHIRMDEVGKRYEEKLFTICQSISDDGGKTWTTPKIIGSTGAPPHLMLHSSGTLICAYGRRTPGYGIQVMFSRDNAETWDTDYYIWDEGESADLGYPASVELDNGDIFTVFYAAKKGEKLPSSKDKKENPEMKTYSGMCSILWTRWRIPE
ncbi:MAG TPA: exo-alpha-sialidase [Clostridiaceae bacterium]|nr:exo-alpha-sialidase [Clostridiaceae bacterium]